MKFLNWLQMFVGLIIPTNSLRSFLRKWLSSFSWIVYFSSVYDAFFFPSVLLGHSLPLKNKNLCNLFKLPLNNWSQAVVLFNKHQYTHKSQPEKTFDRLHTDTQLH